MKLRVSTHKPHPMLWLVALVLFIYALLPFGLPYSSVAMIVSALLLLLGTTII